VLSKGLGIIIVTGELLAKLLKARGKRHSGQAKRDPESRIFKQFWIPAGVYPALDAGPE
jgi:hypothetical protein